mmetsp:Transcript_29533/g.57099  ORF Transcript_29533/g.57099 Transcript_29533/m.57099 type:complete len:559 (-) Transcript_29533:63-1739(-)
MTEAAKSWKTRWARKTPSASGSTESLTVPLAEESPPPNVPRIQRLRLRLLGGNSGVRGVSKADVASALLRGLTADYPSKADPFVDCEGTFFEKAWDGLLDEPADFATALTGDRWGMGPLGSWSIQNRVHFDKRICVPPFEDSAAEETVSLCAGCPEKLGLASCTAFREALKATRFDVEGLEGMHKNLHTKAESRPRELVWVNKPLPGVLASFARYSPEVGACCSGLPGCGTAVLDIFEVDKRPLGNKNNVAMLYLAAPHVGTHKGLTPGKLLCAIQDAGSNIARLLREYNWLAGGEGSKEWERNGWKAIDVRAKAEYCLSTKNLEADPFFQEQLATAEDGWLDAELVRGFPPVFMMGSVTQKELLDALSSSKFFDTKAFTSGKAMVRRGTGVHEKDIKDEEPEKEEQNDEKTEDNAEGGEKRKAEDSAGDKDPKKQAPGPARDAKDMPPPMMRNPNFDWNDPLLCWDFAKGFCSRGANCNFNHKPITAAGLRTVLGGHQPSFKAGTRVVIQGLKSGQSSQYNDRVGECENYDYQVGRWQVRLGNGQKLKIKEENMKRC